MLEVEGPEYESFGSEDKVLVDGLFAQIEQQKVALEEIKERQQCQKCFHSFNDTDHVQAKGACVHALYCMKCLKETAARKNASCPACRAPLKRDEIVEVKSNF